MIELKRTSPGAFKNRNFMTPAIEGYGTIKPGLYFEISSGEFMGKPLYGVTLATNNDMLTGDDRNGAFPSLEAALEHVEKLQAEGVKA